MLTLTLLSNILPTPALLWAAAAAAAAGEQVSVLDLNQVSVLL
jgi:hypothetical protein